VGEHVVSYAERRKAQLREEIVDAAFAVFAERGYHQAGIAEIAERDLARLRRERPAVVEDVVADGITLIGDEPSSLFRRR
jgi:hypothetical protein